MSADQNFKEKLLFEENEKLREENELLKQSLKNVPLYSSFNYTTSDVPKYRQWIEKVPVEKTKIVYVPVEKKTLEYEEVVHYQDLPRTVRYARSNYSDNVYLDQYPVIHKSSSYRPLYDYYHPGSTYGLWNYDYPRYKTSYINNEPLRSTYYSDHIYPYHGLSRKYL